ncbi:hypothetical protein QBC46DRAFT_130805 [Diplogelasinospora grovesii]|uniref:F-box domain-containing protein n=1 Tax=Diplogelasinospora grovesii TaxID=303347 RepID=A0AAN6NJU8_9PEZI|nr:hypothetical protein QBC46DRAFT_130805 [Diplogelasinospora grovesii]
MSIAKLPYELVSYVVQHLDLEDVRNLSLTCRRFQYLVHEENIAKAILNKQAPASLEAQTARVSKRYSPELRRLVKRREAISSVSPYLAAIVAVAETWLFENGVLCYIHDRQLRILDLHHSASSEIVVNIRPLLNEAIEESRASRKYKFQLLYYAHDIVSCLYTHAMPEQASWLVVFNARENRILTAPRLASAYKIFVRNNDKFLYYGTHTDFGDDGFRRWMIKGYDISANQWFKCKASLPEMAGSDIGSTICFEIIDGYFYGLSNQTTFEVTEIDLTSYYVCFRFPLSRRGFYEIERAARKRMWRRQNGEGVIDDRWTFVRMFKDEATGMLKVVESRKEWLAGHSSARRTYYTTEISFEGARRQHEWDEDSADEEDWITEAWDKIQSGSITAPSRDPHLVHPGDDASEQVMLTLSQCPVRSYQPYCQTFLDVVNDTSSSDSNGQRIRIRGGSRRPWPPGELQKRRRLSPAQGRDPEPAFEQMIHDLYKHEGVALWPPEQDPARPDPALDELYTLLSPPSHRGNVHGTWDDRCLVYATGGTSGGLKAIIFVSFDPSIRLIGARPYSGRLILGRPAGMPHCGPRTSSKLYPADPELSYEGKGKGKEKHKNDAWNPTSEPNATWHADMRPPESDSGTSPRRRDRSNHGQWSSFGKAMYRDISCALHFGL